MLRQSSSFYVTLSSARSKDVFPNNKPNSFKNQLPRELMLDGDWEVGMTELSYPSTWNSIDKAVRIQFIIYRMDFDGKILGQYSQTNRFENREFKIPLQYNYPIIKFILHHNPTLLEEVISLDSIVITIPVGRYSITTLEETFKKLLAAELSKINRTKHKFFGIELEFGNLMDFGYNASLNRFCSKLKYPFVAVILYKDDDGARLFGLPPIGPPGYNLSDVSADFVFPFAPRLRTTKTLYCYSDIIDNDLVGDTLVPLLRTVEVSGEHGEFVHMPFDKPYYKRVTRSVIPSIEIQLNSETGEEVKFTSGEVECTLNFRRVTR